MLVVCNVLCLVLVDEFNSHGLTADVSTIIM
jgi:hypothetical protein